MDVPAGEKHQPGEGAAEYEVAVVRGGDSAADQLRLVGDPAHRHGRPALLSS
jgi:hypothetical protein